SSLICLFSSRRRHTRSKRDWSSDVCSSDLELVNTIHMMLSKRYKMKKQRAKPKKRSEKEQKIINDAKALLMERNHMTEEEAHRYIQKCSMDTGTNLVETAEMITTLMND